MSTANGPRTSTDDSEAPAPSPDAVGGGLGVPPSEPIATLPPIDDSFRGVPVSARTGQPRRHPLMITANVFLYAGAMTGLVSYAVCWWQAIHMHTWPTASRLIMLMNPSPGSLKSVIAAVLMTLVALIVVAGSSIAAFQAWNGHRWSRSVAIGAFVLSFLGPLLNQIAWAAPPLVAIGTILLWLPPVGRYFDNWQLFRTPDPQLRELAADVSYGPLPRYH